MNPKFEWLKVRGTYRNDDFILDKNGNHLSWQDDIPSGWNKAFGESMIDELNDILVKFNFVDKYRIMQIKEKFGSLRWYDNGVPKEAYEEYSEWLDKIEILSEKTCISCGELATHTTSGWIVPLCDSCGKS